MAEIFGNTTATPIKPDLFRNKVDNTFNPESHNPQSGKAVAEAVEQSLGYVNMVLAALVEVE